MILITGATGNTGREVTRLLRARGVSHRCLVRRPEAVAALAGPDVEVVVADFDRPETLAPALDGVERAFLVCTPDARLVDRESAFVKAAADAGVEHIVKLSALGAGLDAPTPNLRFHGRVEAALATSGMTWNVLRPHGFTQTTYWFSARQIHEDGVLACPAGEGRVPMVDLRDVAEAAVKALLGEVPPDRAYDLTGPAAVSFREFADAIGGALGKAVRYVDLPEPVMQAGLRQMGVADCSIEHTVTIFRMIRAGQLARTRPGFAELGLEPRSIHTFADDLAGGLTGGATSFHPPPAV